MNQLINFKSSYINNINYYLIIIFPISLLAGSLVSNLFLITISILFLIELKIQKRFYILKNNNLYFLILIYIYLILNSIFIANNEESLIRSIGFIRFVIFAYALSYYFYFYEKKLVKYWTIIFLIVAFDIIFEYLFGKNILGNFADYPGRIASFTGDELKIGTFFLGLFFIALNFFKKKNDKIFLLIFFVFIGISFLIGERSNFIKFVIISVLYFIFFNKISFKKKIIFFLITLLFSILILNSNHKLRAKYTNHIIFDNYENILDQNQKVNLNSIINNNQHFLHYYVAAKIFYDNPIFGSGAKTFRYESQKNRYNDLQDLHGGSTHPHQFHFEILSELGIIGYILIISHLLALLIAQKKKDLSFLTVGGILYIIATLVPLLPSGSFFTSYTAAFFWINYSFLIGFNLKKI